MLSSVLIAFMLLIINNGSVASKCSPGCKCIWTGYCHGCNDGYYIIYKNLCKICSADCLTCSSNRICTECKAGFYLNPYDNDENICHPCTKGCSVCSSKDECYQCDTGYFRNGGSCRKCPKNCTICISENECLECNDGYYRNGTLCLACPSVFYWHGSACLSCLDNCASCEMHYECTECKPGYFGRTCTRKCYPGCVDDVCDKETGKCNCEVNFHGESCVSCIPRKFGPACNQDCHENCWTCNSYENCTMCVDGYFGERCEWNCSTGCSESSCNPINGICDKCKPSYYGHKCEMRCPSGCLDDVCDRETGACFECKPLVKWPNCTNCEDGYWGKDCRNHCPNSCRSCLSTTECTKCKDGFHGEICEQKCSYGCLSDMCDQNTSACSKSCKINFTGPFCSQCISGMYGPNCSAMCPENCYGGICDTRHGECLQGCIPYFFGKYCNSSCPSNCKKCTSETSCQSCEDRFRGERCHLKCPIGCLHGTCRSNGHCHACIPGIFGEYCNMTCPENCIVSSCNISGYCNDCKPGYFGTFCSNPCPPNCFSGECLRNGSCYSCLPGFYGSRCDRYCPKHCYSCTDDMLCKSCFGGFYGQFCQDKCSYCKTGTYCNIDTGDCQVCEDGLYGNKCRSKCDTKCQTCDISSGHKCLMCKIGSYGRIKNSGFYHCSTRCPRNCMNTTCNADYGTCDYGCERGYWGEQCELECPTNCLNGDCHSDNGSCRQGCLAGFSGDKCDCPVNCICYLKGTCAKCKTGFGKLAKNVVGFYGEDCRYSCSENCRNRTCDRETGSCDHGCLEGFKGVMCSQETTIENTSSTTRQLGSVILLVSVVILAISIIVVAVILLKKRQNPKRERVVSGRFGEVVAYRQVRSTCDRSEDNSLGIVSIKRNNKQKQRISGNKKHNAACPESSASNDENHPTHCLPESTAEYATIERKHVDMMFQEGAAECSETFDDHIYFNADEVMKRKIPLDQLREFVQNKTIDNYVEEFKELPSGLIKPHKASQKRENILKNRYRDIYPYDSKRVILREGKSDYINASYIDGYMKQRAYIASIGPTIKQMGADFDVFWNMVWQERVGKIVMLTNLRESGIQKCDKYWPDEGCCNKYGNVKVMCQVEEIYANYTARIFTMEKTEKRTLYQMHFTAWPDKSTPKQVSSLTDFWEKVKGISTTEDGPIIVHCSAGVGRTGTYIALDILANEGMSEGHVDIFACVRNLREERVCLVQTVGQYRFLHEALLQILSPDNTHV